jgi:hypothetical protein
MGKKWITKSKKKTKGKTTLDCGQSKLDEETKNLLIKNIHPPIKQIMCHKAKQDRRLEYP